jgi:hypothetical protein
VTGYEQVRSVACALVGDEAGARSVELVLPETGVCSADPAAGAGPCGDDQDAAVADGDGLPAAVTVAGAGAVGPHSERARTLVAAGGRACC